MNSDAQCASSSPKGLNRLYFFWNILTNIGIDAQTTDVDRKRVRLINGISALCMLIYALYALNGLMMSTNYVCFESLLGLTGFSISLWLNHKRKYQIAAYYTVGFASLIILFMSIANGGLDSVHYMFVIISIGAILFFRTLWPIIGFFLLNLGLFAVSRYIQLHYPPLFTFPGEETLSISNHILLFAIPFLIVYYFKSENTAQEGLLARKNESLATEKAKSDALLRNILPDETVEELKNTGLTQPKRFSTSTVMFTDFCDFTKISRDMSPEELVSELNYCFSHFDSLMDKYSIEKIKTIGDAYMCVGGIPTENEAHARDIVLAALDILQFMAGYKKERLRNNQAYFDLRIGIHTGPIVAGVVGTKKFAYDVWGDTVNTASRLESSGEAGKINISGATYALISDAFRCTYRGKVEAKSKGLIDMYFVDGELG